MSETLPEEFPDVNEVVNEQPINDGEDYQGQRTKCLEAIKKIGPKQASSLVIFHSIPSEQLVGELEEKGYIVRYTLDYDVKRTDKYLCRLRIINPKIEEPACAFMNNLEENLKKLGFDNNQNTADLKNMFSGFMTSF